MAMSFPSGSVSLCASQSFPTPVVPHAHFHSINSSLVTNFSGSAPSSQTFNHPTINFTDISLCNITIQYTHPEVHDLITVMAWLPIGSWNGRFQAVGGASASAGLNSISLYEMYAAVGQGYATISTNAGQINNTRDLSGWGLDENGYPNIAILKNLASTSLGDEALIGKSLINSFYGQAPLYSYFSGCSQGGRQGLMLAQKYPRLYDGIVASAPDINWGQLIPSRVWPQVVMNSLKEYPEGCELDYLGEAAISTCDELDGVKDGIISAMDKCTFDPFSHVGQSFNCTSSGKIRSLSSAAAKVANATWTGPRDTDGKFLWYGLNYGADISGDLTGRDANAVTKCFSNGTCVGEPLALGVQWLQYFASENDPSFDFEALTIPEFANLVDISVTKYGPIIGTDNPDLSAFREVGGKILGYHGLSDPTIPTAGSIDYYERVATLIPHIRDFYRLYEVPGLGHCGGQTTNQPMGIFDALIAWVEHDIKPDSLSISFPVDGKLWTRPICPYPESAIYDGAGNPSLSTSYACR